MKRNYTVASIVARVAACLAGAILAGCSGPLGYVGDTPGTGVRSATPSQTAAPTSRVKRFEITRRELFAGGMVFGDVGAYEKLVGIATLELDAGDARNAAIVDKDRVARNAMGKIEYSTEVYILRPADPARGNGKLFSKSTTAATSASGPTSTILHRRPWRSMNREPHKMPATAF